MIIDYLENTWSNTIMMKKSLLATAIIAASSSAFAGLEVDVNGAKTFASERFGSDAVIATMTAGTASSVELEVTSILIAQNQQGTVTYTLSDGTFQAADLPAVADLTTSNCAGGASTGPVTLAPVITAGGAAGDSSVTYGFTVTGANFSVGDCLDWAVPAVNGLSTLGTAGSTVDVAVTTSAVGTVDPFNPVPSTVTLAAGKSQTVATSAKALSVDFTVLAGATSADIELADRTKFEDTTAGGLASETIAILGEVQTNNTGTAVDADGATAADYAAADAVTVVVTGEDLTGIASAYIDVDGSNTFNAGDYAGTISGNTITFIATTGTDLNTAREIQIVADGTSSLASGDNTATASVDLNAVTDIDFTNAASSPLVSLSFAGLTAANERALVVTNDTSADPTFIRVTNVTGNTLNFFGQMTTQAGVVGDLVEMTALAPNETRVISSADVVSTFGTFTGRSNIEFSTTGAATDVQILNLVRTNDVLTNLNK